MKLPKEKRNSLTPAIFLFSGLITLICALPSLAVGSNLEMTTDKGETLEANKEGTSILTIEIFCNPSSQKCFRTELQEIIIGERVEVVIYTMKGQVILKDAFTVSEGNSVHRLIMDAPENANYYIMKAVGVGRNVTKKFHL